jgi:hypothetical protein
LTDYERGVRFDLNGNGAKEKLSWTEADTDDAWLTLDHDGDGRINNGRELFGNFTPQPSSVERNGFFALAEFDRPEQGGNGDGVIDVNDSIYASLRLWQDADHDGVSATPELHALSSLGVESVSLDYKESRKKDRHGNEFRYRSKVNGRGRSETGQWAYDVFLLNTPRGN